MAGDRAGNGSESIIVRESPAHLQSQRDSGNVMRSSVISVAMCGGHRGDLPEIQLMRPGPVLMIIAGLSHGRLLSLMCQ